jgi:hypothetical protein
MLLHLGGDWAASSRRIVAILDYGSVAGSRATKAVLRKAEKEGLLEHISEGAETRSLVLLDAGRGTRVVLSPISASALRGRLAGGAPAVGFTDAGPAEKTKTDRKGR